MTPNTIVARNEQKYLISVIGDEVVMMDIQKGVYIGMNSVGSNIWNLLSEALPVKDIINSLTAKYDISPEQCEKETITYLEQMLEQDMLMIRN
jgi:hypothetical protein